MSGIKLSIVALSLSLSAACAAPNVQLSAQGAAHSGTAAGMSAATVIAAPLIVGGGSLAVSGAALESVGTEALEGGSQVLDATVSPARPVCAVMDRNGLCVAADAPPSL